MSNEHFILIGTAKVGLQPVAAVLNCSVDTLVTPVIFKNIEYLSSPKNIYVMQLSENTYKEMGIKILNNLNTIGDNVHFIWVVRNPIISASTAKSPTEFLRYWHDTNMCLWYLSVSLQERIFLVRFEDFIRGYHIKKLFDFVGIDFNKQFLRYGDFDIVSNDDQFISTSQTFQRGYLDKERICPYSTKHLASYWRQYKHKPLTTFLGYNNFDCE